MSRQNMIYLVVGRIGSGKTDDIKNMAMRIYKNNPTMSKLVVFDEFDTDVWQNMETWNHPEWAAEKLPVISEEQLLRLKSGMVRILQAKDNHEHYFDLFRNLRNTVLIIEDTTRMVDPESVIPKSLKKLLFDVKQKNIDLFLVFHSLMDVPSKLARNVRVICLHHTDDGECPKKFTNPKLKLAFDALKAKNPDKHPFEKIDVPVNVNLTVTR